MNHLNLILSSLAVLSSAALISSLSIQSECYIEQRVKAALSGNTNKAITDTLVLFVQKALSESQNGSISQAWARNYALQAMVADLGSTPSGSSILTYANGVLTQPSNTTGYCDLFTRIQSGVATLGGLSNDQQVEFSTLIDFAYEIARGQSCNIWGQLASDPSTSQTLQAAANAMTCQQQSMLAQLTGCNYDSCNPSNNHP